VGIDMLLYTLLVLLYRMDLKVAVPTSVVIMAAASIMGSGLQLARGGFEPEILYYWLAASPVVILGAPLGAYFVSIVPRITTLYFVAILCVAQFFWTVQQVGPSPSEWVFVVLHLTLALTGFWLLYSVGRASSVRLLASPASPDARRDPSEIARDR